MVTTELRQSGDDLVVTVPREEVERLRLRAGQRVTIDVRPAEDRPTLASDLEAIADNLIRKHEAALRYLAEN